MDSILPYYLRERDLLKSATSDFAERYPSVAAGLELYNEGSRDPHVRLLLDTFTFLAARTKKNIDQSAAQLTGLLIEQLAPSLLKPMPSVSIAALELKPAGGKVTQGYALRKGAELYAHATTGTECRFSTTWETRLFPLRVAGTRLHEFDKNFGSRGRTGSFGIAIDLEVTDGSRLDGFNLPFLDFYVDTELQVYDRLLPSLLTDSSVWLQDEEGKLTPIKGGFLRPLSFQPEEALLPSESPMDFAFGLIKSYIASPEMFTFYRLTLNCPLQSADGSATLVVGFDRPLPQSLRTMPEFHTNRVPVINLFKRTSEPINLERSSYEYLLHGNMEVARSEEVFAVERVSGTRKDASGSNRFQHLLDAGGFSLADQRPRWIAKSEDSIRPNIGGTDTYLSFTNAAHVSNSPNVSVVYASLICSNRRVAEQMYPGTQLHVEGKSSALTAELISSPSPVKYVDREHSSQLKLLRLLGHSLGRLFTLEEEDVSEPLREFLSDIDNGSDQFLNQIQGISSAQIKKEILPVANAKYPYRFDMLRGYLLSITLDPDRFIGASPMLFVTVIAHVLAHFVHANNFIQLEVKVGEIDYRWQAKSGFQSAI